MTIPNCRLTPNHSGVILSPIGFATPNAGDARW